MRNRIVGIAVFTLVGGGSALAAEALPPLRTAGAEPVALIRDGGFEDPEAKAWNFSDWPPRPETGVRLIADSITYSQDVVFVGEYAICFDFRTIGADRALLVQQGLPLARLAPYDGRRLRMSARMWVAQGPPGCQGHLTMRQWPERGRPPIAATSCAFSGGRGEWTQTVHEFTLRLGPTTRGDFTVGFRQVPDLAQAPVIYVDDVHLEVLPAPRLSATLLGGVNVAAPDTLLPLRVTVADAVWAAASRHLRWDITSRDGLTGYARGNTVLAAPAGILEVEVPELPFGRYAIRLALGRERDAREAELLVPFRWVSGPFRRSSGGEGASRP